MENDLIRRSDAIETIRNQCVIGKMWGGEEAESTLIDAYDTIDEVSDVPAVDAVEVVHANWEDGNKSIRNPTGYAFNWWCSHCGKPQYSPVAKNLEEFTKDNPYCHKCGARMDGQRREDDDA